MAQTQILHLFCLHLKQYFCMYFTTMILITWDLSTHTLAIPPPIPLEARQYLEKYHYIVPNKNHRLASYTDFKEAILKFQNFAGLSVTGFCDEETITMMSQPRCGVADLPTDVEFNFYDTQPDDIGLTSTNELANDLTDNHDWANPQNLLGYGQNRHQHHSNRLESIFPPSNRASSQRISRARRYILQGSRWAKKDLKYSVDKYTTDLLRDTIDSTIERAFSVWTQHADLRIRKTSSANADIVVSFERGIHGDGEPFDGPGRVLAHAFFPQFGGDAHFDDDEKWSTSAYQGANLYQVAAHEFGHSLGLSHSNVTHAIMAPFYKTYMGYIKLHADDIKAIQKLYGAPRNYNNKQGDRTLPTTPSTTSYRRNYKTPVTTAPSGGGRSWLNDVFELFNFHNRHNAAPHLPNIPAGGGTHFPSSGGNRPRYSTNRPVLPPRTTLLPKDHKNDADNDIPGAREAPSPGIQPHHKNNNDNDKKKDICSDTRTDAITHTVSGDTIVFKDQYYWELNDDGIKVGFPRLIINDFPGLTGSVDAALSWGGRVNKLFLFKGSKYWRYSFDKKLDIGYPKLISKGFPGLPDDLDAAFVWSGNGMTYFIKNNQYWRYAGTSPDGVDEGYPKQLHIWEGLPVKIDDAMRWKNGKTYFFAGSDYYRFNDESFKVDDTFPRSAALWWFGCLSNQYRYNSSRFDSVVPVSATDSIVDDLEDDQSLSFIPLEEDEQLPITSTTSHPPQHTRQKTWGGSDNDRASNVIPNIFYRSPYNNNNNQQGSPNRYGAISSYSSYSPKPSQYSSHRNNHQIDSYYGNNGGSNSIRQQPSSYYNYRYSALSKKPKTLDNIYHLNSTNDSYTEFDNNNHVMMLNTSALAALIRDKAVQTGRFDPDANSQTFHDILAASYKAAATDDDASYDKNSFGDKSFHNDNAINTKSYLNAPQYTSSSTSPKIENNILFIIMYISIFVCMYAI